MDVIIKVMESIVKMNRWTVERFDIQAYDHGYDITGFVGYLNVKEEQKTLVIRKDGSFEFLEQ